MLLRANVIEGLYPKDVVTYDLHHADILTSQDLRWSTRLLTLIVVIFSHVSDLARFMSEGHGAPWPSAGVGFYIHMSKLMLLTVDFLGEFHLAEPAFEPLDHQMGCVVVPTHSIACRIYLWATLKRAFEFSRYFEVYIDSLSFPSSKALGLKIFIFIFTVRFLGVGLSQSQLLALNLLSWGFALSSEFFI